MSESSAPDAEAGFHPAEGAEIPSALFCVCGWEIEGSFWAHDYAILAGGGEIVTNHKEWMSWGDCCELDIADGQDEVPALRGAGDLLRIGCPECGSRCRLRKLDGNEKAPGRSYSHRCEPTRAGAGVSSRPCVCLQTGFIPVKWLRIQRLPALYTNGARTTKRIAKNKKFRTEKSRRYRRAGYRAV